LKDTEKHSFFYIAVFGYITTVLPHQNEKLKAYLF